MNCGLAFPSSTVSVETVVPALGHVDAWWKSKYWGGWVRTTNLLVNRNVGKCPIPVIFA